MIGLHLTVTDMARYFLLNALSSLDIRHLTFTLVVGVARLDDALPCLRLEFLPFGWPSGKAGLSTSGENGWLSVGDGGWPNSSKWLPWMMLAISPTKNEDKK